MSCFRHHSQDKESRANMISYVRAGHRRNKQGMDQSESSVGRHSAAGGAFINFVYLFIRSFILRLRVEHIGTHSKFYNISSYLISDAKYPNLTHKLRVWSEKTCFLFLNFFSISPKAVFVCVYVRADDHGNGDQLFKFSHCPLAYLPLAVSRHPLPFPALISNVHLHTCHMHIHIHTLTSRACIYFTATCSAHTD